METIKAFLDRPAPVKWLFYGDSITHGVYFTFGQRDYTQLFAERVRFEMERTMDTVINTAISGNTTRDLLETFSVRVEPYRPDVVFVMIGMNDCSTESGIQRKEFENNLQSLLERITALGAAPVLQTTCPVLPGSAATREVQFPGFMDVIREVAETRGVPLVDHARFWDARPNQHHLWMADSFHPNAYGHRAFAKTLCCALDIHDPESPVCRLFVP